MKKYLKKISVGFLALSLLGGALVTSRLQAKTAREVKQEAKATQRRVLPVLVFGGIQLVWNLFAADGE